MEDAPPAPLLRRSACSGFRFGTAGGVRHRCYIEVYGATPLRGTIGVPVPAPRLARTLPERTPVFETLLNRERRILIAIATPLEAGRLFDPDRLPRAEWSATEIAPRVELVITGVGKSNAAGAAGKFLDPERHCGVLSLGVAGALPGSGLEPGDVVAASACVFADEGVETPDGFQDCAAMGFPLGRFPGSAVPVDPEWMRFLAPRCRVLAPIATVSTCSGTDSLASRVRARTGAVAEAMEGAAVAQVAHRLGLKAGEVRAVSNTTGDRPRQRWDIARALTALKSVIGGL